MHRGQPHGLRKGGSEEVGEGLSLPTSSRVWGEVSMGERRSCSKVKEELFKGQGGAVQGREEELFKEVRKGGRGTGSRVEGGPVQD